MINRPLPEVYDTTEHDSVRYKEEPVTVRLYSSEKTAVVAKLSVQEAGQLAGLLLGWAIKKEYM